MKHIRDIASELDLAPENLEFYGDRIAKLKSLPDIHRPPGKLVLVSAITPTPAGEGKTTTSIGLAQGMARLGHRVCVALREPSLGPCFGMKGGGTGGGRCELLPVDRINLHFTGDFHAITSANNLIAALLDNQLHFGGPLSIDPRSVTWRRVLDMNDRALRDIVIGLGGKSGGVPRQTGFDITAASELMAILCLANDQDDFRQRVDRTLLGYTLDKQPVTCQSISATGAVLALMKDALRPNLVGTTEGVPAWVHGGPFANIAHGCSSVIATRTGMRLSDWTITEAGFGFDLGAEKFFDIKCRSANLDVVVVVLVATIRALKFHGGKKLSQLDQCDPSAVEAGLPNLTKHLENVHCFGKRALVALNQFPSDDAAEIEVVRAYCATKGIPFSVSDHFRKGGSGASDLAGQVVELGQQPSSPFQPLYELSESPLQKIQAVATQMYGAHEVSFTKQAERDLKRLEEEGFAHLPVCMAKTPSSLSDDPQLRGRPHDFAITVQQVKVNSGAGFLVVLTGDIIRMPGLPRHPLAESVDVTDGEITGLG